MKRIYIALLTSLFLGACASSKFNYKDAYKFSHYDYNKKSATEVVDNTDINLSEQSEKAFDPQKVGIEEDPTTASIVDRPAELPNAEASIQKLAEKVQAHKEAQKNPKVSLSKEDKRAFKKEVKRDFKDVKNQLKQLKQEEAKNVSMNQKIYIGIIIAVAGLVIAILASTGIGALAIIVGVVLIAWGLIEQGAF